MYKVIFLLLQVKQEVSFSILNYSSNIHLHCKSGCSFLFIQQKELFKESVIKIVLYINLKEKLQASSFLYVKETAMSETLSYMDFDACS